MSLLATRVQDWRVKNPAFDKNMTRPLEWGALNFFVNQTNAPNSILSSRLKERAFNSVGNSLTIPVINYDASVTVGNTRSCTVADDENDSALYTVVFATYVIGFTMVPAMYMNNEIDYQHDFDRKMEKVTRALGQALDIAAITALTAQKTQVFGDLLYYTQTGNVLQIPWDMRTEVLSDVSVMQRANAYPGRQHIIGNAGVFSILKKLEQHGEYNDVNKQLEYLDKVLHYTQNITNESGRFGTFFAVEDGNVGVLTRVDREALRNSSANFHEWGVVNLPMIDLPVGYHYYTSVGDYSAVAGAATADMTCVIKEFYGFSVDVAFLVAYNSSPSTVANPIMKGEILQSPYVNPMVRPVVIVNDEDTPIFTSEVV